VEIPTRSEASAGSDAGGAKARGMWFRRRRRPEQLDLSALDGLAELVGRIVALLPEQREAQQPQPSPEPIRARIPAPLPPPVLPEPTARTESAEPAAQQAELLFVATASGYRLLESEGGAAARGDRVELADGSFRVLRLGPSPLPGDRRRCAFLAREEPSAEARTPDG
jgi:hypothetical protein